MNNKFITALSLASLFFSSFTIASVYTQCNTCSSYTSFKNVAKHTDSIDGDGTGLVYVANHGSSELRKFMIIKEQEAGIIISSVVEKQLTSQEVSKFSDILIARRNVIDVIENKGDVPSSIAKSAYNLAGASYVVNDVSDYYTKTATFSQKMSAYISSLATITGTVANVPIVIELSFSDGSVGQFKITPTIGDSVAIAIISLIDADNNTIPLTENGYKSGSYRFDVQGDAGVNRFVSAAARYGVYVTTTAGGESTGGGQSMSCSTDSDGNVKCIIRKTN